MAGDFGIPTVIDIENRMVERAELGFLNGF